MKANELAPDSRKTLYQLRNKMAEEGIEMTPDDLIQETFKLNNFLLERDTSLIEVQEMTMMLDQSPPPPPYKCGFDDEAEMREFKERAEKKYSINLNVVQEGRIFYLVEDKK